jgi:hypothetical protein
MALFSFENGLAEAASIGSAILLFFLQGRM